MIIEYSIVYTVCTVVYHAQACGEMIQKVNNRIEKGWEPIGGITERVYGDTITIIQAVVKRDK